MDVSAQAEMLPLMEQYRRYQVVLSEVSNPATLEGSIFQRAVARTSELCSHMGFDESIRILCQQVLTQPPPCCRPRPLEQMQIRLEELERWQGRGGRQATDGAGL